MPPAPAAVPSGQKVKRPLGKATSKHASSKPCVATSATSTPARTSASATKSAVSPSPKRHPLTPTAATRSSLATSTSSSRAVTRSPSLSTNRTSTSSSSSSSSASSTPRPATSASPSRPITASPSPEASPATRTVSFPALPDRSVFELASAGSAGSAGRVMGGEVEDEELPEEVLLMMDDLGLGVSVKQTLRSVMSQGRQSAQHANDEEERDRPAALTLSKVASRCFSGSDLAGNSPQEIEVMLSSCHQLIIDRLSLTAITVLASTTFSRVTHLYLQHNLIADIAPLARMRRLRFVSLASNHISAVPDLTGLEALQFIDLSDNRVDEFEPELLPFELQALRMQHNPCSSHPAYQHHLLAALPYLTLLDGEEVTDELRLSCGLPVGDEGDMDDESAADEIVTAPSPNSSLHAKHDEERLALAVEDIDEPTNH